jgi:hypothetical protein
MRKSALLAAVAVLALAGCGSGSSDEASADQTAADEQPAEAEKTYVDQKKEAVQNLSYGALSLPRFRTITDFLSPEYVYSMGTNARRMYDEDADDEQRVSSSTTRFFFLIPYIEYDGMPVANAAGYISNPRIGWNDDGSINSVMGDLLAADTSPKKFRDAFAKFCQAELSIDTSSAAIIGTASGRYADCKFMTDSPTYSSIVVTIDYKR